MYGAILGDMIGAPYEFDRGGKAKDFPLFGPESRFTDDTVMTLAVADALMDSRGKGEADTKAALIRCMRSWARRYPHAGYGYRFRQWLRGTSPEPYNSYGNGSAMRVSSAGWLADSLDAALTLARRSAEVTHNHPEGVKGAQATATAIYLARCGADKETIRQEITERFGYDLTRTCDEIRPHYHHDESCQKTVPEAITAFLEGESFEDCIRTAVSLGGDTDTLAAITGSIAEACYGVPEDLIEACRKRLDREMLVIVDRFQEMIHDKKEDDHE